MNSNPTVLLIEKGSEQQAFFLTTFLISDYLFFDHSFPIKGDFARSGLAFDNTLYSDAKSLFISPEGEGSIAVTFIKLKFLVQLVDFVAKVLLNDVASNKVEALLKEDLPVIGENFENVKKDYFNTATLFFEGLKENFKDQPAVLDLVQMLVTWDRDNY